MSDLRWFWCQKLFHLTHKHCWPFRMPLLALRCRSDRKTLCSVSVDLSSGLSSTTGPSMAAETAVSWLSISREITGFVVHLGNLQPETHMPCKHSAKFSEGKEITWCCHCHYLASHFLSGAFPFLTTVTSYCSLEPPGAFLLTASSGGHFHARVSFQQNDKTNLAFFLASTIILETLEVQKK